MNTYNRTKPFLSKVISRTRLNNPGSSKETWHVVLDLTGSNITYRPGDSFGICPENDPKMVEIILKHCQATGDEEVIDERTKEPYRFGTWLTKKANLATCSKKFLDIVANGTEETIYNVPEMVEKTGVSLTPQELVKTLSPLLPRLYSIASSQSKHPNEVHLTVSYVRYEVEGRPRFGICSHFLCDLAALDEAVVPVYPQATKDFLLPEDHDTPIVMIGPGTGVAPFRAFMQERVYRKATFGPSWLFFGERHSAHDFLYQEYWQELVNNGQLRLETAFSRDQEEKIYVQDRLWERRKELWSLLQEGGRIYVCGDASRMAKDVDACLQNVACDQGNLSTEAAKAFLTQLRREKRYLRDIY